MPDARMVLLKEYSDQGFVFFTNYQSPKAVQLAHNSWATCVFYWEPLYKQVRIFGSVTKVSEQESDDYFATRPRGSQIGAWASHQSATIGDRAELEVACARIEKQYQAKDIPRPLHWGGYRLMPERIEFWQGRDNRLHDRELYVLKGGVWVMTRLSP
jgi:pyridoxamine 5'-phosphate oxidase